MPYPHIDVGVQEDVLLLILHHIQSLLSQAPHSSKDAHSWLHQVYLKLILVVIVVVCCTGYGVACEVVKVVD